MTIAQGAIDVLEARFGKAAWILQVAEGIRLAVENGIRQFSTGGVTENAVPTGGRPAYAFPARTAAELQATEALAADSRHVDAQVPIERVRDPAAAAGGPPPAAAPRRVIVPNEKGWLL